MDVQDAVRHSITAFGTVFPPEMQEGLRLEEVVLSPDEEVWLTTVSFRNPDLSDLEPSPPVPAQNGLAAFFGATPSKRRLYKTIRVRANDGHLLGIVNSK